jgi:molecular chaperone GrpE
VTTDNDRTPADSAQSGEQNAPPTPEGSIPVTAQVAATESAGQPSELDQVKAERDKLREQLMRTAADFDNFRKRTKRDLDDVRQRGKDDLIRDLLPVFDNLERAVQTGTGAGDASSVLEGVRMVLKLFEDTVERLGLSRVPTVGQRFDPAVHEALQQQETDAHPSGTVIAEIAPGYRFGERLVRPAMVVVARKPAEKKVEPPAPTNGKGSDATIASAAPSSGDGAGDSEPGGADKTE